MRYCTNKDINAIVRNLIRHGWSFHRGGKHGKLRHPSGHPLLTVPNSPSDWRAALNFGRDVKRVC
jgi:hypothetical protein